MRLADLGCDGFLCAVKLGSTHGGHVVHGVGGGVHDTLRRLVFVHLLGACARVLG